MLYQNMPVERKESDLDDGVFNLHWHTGVTSIFGKQAQYDSLRRGALVRICCPQAGDRSITKMDLLPKPSLWIEYPWKARNPRLIRFARVFGRFRLPKTVQTGLASDSPYRCPDWASCPTGLA